MTTQINLISKEDMEIVRNLAHEIWPVAYKNILKPHEIQNMLEKIYSVNNLQQEMESGHVFWVVKERGMNIGFASAYIEDLNLWLKKLYILPEMQGKGYGKFFISEIVKHFNNAKTILLYVNSSNTPAQKFYEKLGFKITGSTPVKMGDYDFLDFIVKKSLI